LQSGVPKEGRRTRIVGPLGKLPEERQHRLYRRPRAEVGSGDAAHPELRPQVAERDQGSAGPDGAASRHGSAGLAAGEHRRARQALRGSLLDFVIPGRARARTRNLEIPDRRFATSGMTKGRTQEAYLSNKSLASLRRTKGLKSCVTEKFIASSIAPTSIAARCSPICAPR